jgi:hypothetical protein
VCLSQGILFKIYALFAVAMQIFENTSNALLSHAFSALCYRGVLCVTSVTTHFPASRLSYRTSMCNAQHFVTRDGCLRVEEDYLCSIFNYST